MTAIDIEETTEETKALDAVGDMESFELLARLRLASRLASREHAPELGEEALHGLAGRIVRTIAPLTEASVPAMLLTLLVSFSAMVGRNAYTYVGPQKHYPVLFGVVVGRSARGRKGTGAAAVRPILDAADAEFMKERQIRGGLQSGEALIQAAASADPLNGDQDNADQRLLLVEEEYGRMLTVSSRKGSTLSPILRSAWDSDVLGARTKHENLAASNAHVGVLGQVTMAELTTILKPVDVMNGYANRFLHVFSQRSALLPEPGRLEDAQVEDFGSRLREAVDFASDLGEVHRSANFRVAWAKLYPILELQPSGGLVYDSLASCDAQAGCPTW